MRSNRSHSGAPLASLVASNRTSGPVGWTDDGLPFDASVEQFNTAFDGALRDSLASLLRANEQAAESSAQQSEAQPRAQVDNTESGEKLGYEYMYKYFNTVRDQLQKGGVRLAHILNQIYG